jgi:tetratricopeptide (TPR) repeat protein
MRLERNRWAGVNVITRAGAVRETAMTLRIGAALATAAVVGVISTSLHALYARLDLEKVPVARLVSNLERDLTANPKNADLHVQLGRLYGMAYAANVDELPVVTRGEKQEVWFGHEPKLVPYASTKSQPADRASARTLYLQRSLEHYRHALTLDPESQLARLGYGWTLERSGDTAGAITAYRRVIEKAWPKEQAARMAGLGERFYTQEAAEYLIPLLDPQRDAAEIAELTRRRDGLRRLPRPVTPIAVALVDETTPARVVDLEAQVSFDADGSGLRRRWTWITPDAGWLVYDATRTGDITSALQLFGNVTFWLFWTHGYDALASLDDDNDRQLTGAELRHLAVWHDRNRDGISDRHEVRPLAEHGIVSLSSRSVPGDGLIVAAHNSEGVRLKDGRTRPTYDVILRHARSVSSPAPD